MNLKKIESDKLITAKINNNDDIYGAIKAFLGKGILGSKMSLNSQLTQLQAEIEQLCPDFGLDFFETRFEVLGLQHAQPGGCLRWISDPLSSLAFRDGI
jgi:hypothetical protein